MIILQQLCLFRYENWTRTLLPRCPPSYFCLQSFYPWIALSFVYLCSLEETKKISLFCLSLVFLPQKEELKLRKSEKISWNKRKRRWWMNDVVSVTGFLVQHHLSTEAIDLNLRLVFPQKKRWSSGFLFPSVSVACVSFSLVSCGGLFLFKRKQEIIISMVQWVAEVEEEVLPRDSNFSFKLAFCCTTHERTRSPGSIHPPYFQ